MPLSDWLEKAKDAASLIATGRAALTEIVDAVKDGKEGIDAATAEEINRIFEAERVENRAAYNKLSDAIARYRQRHGG